MIVIVALSLSTKHTSHNNNDVWFTNTLYRAAPIALPSESTIPIQLVLANLSSYAKSTIPPTAISTAMNCGKYYVYAEVHKLWEKDTKTCPLVSPFYSSTLLRLIHNITLTDGTSVMNIVGESFLLVKFNSWCQILDNLIGWTLTNAGEVMLELNLVNSSIIPTLARLYNAGTSIIFMNPSLLFHT